MIMANFERKGCLQRNLTGWGGGVLSKFLGGEAPPQVQPLTLLYTIFHDKGTHFVYLLLTNGIPFTYLVYSFAPLLTAINALSFR